MANNITLFKKYVPLLDEVYKQSALSSVLDSDTSLAQAGANANEIIIPKISMDGLGDYTRNSGYTQGDVTLTNETVKFNYDRGRKFSVDWADNEETAGLAFGKLASEFIRTKVAPEGDAFTFAKICGVDGISKATAGTFADGNAVLSALVTAQNKMDEDEVPYENRILFITPTLYNMIQAVDSYKSKEVMASFSQVVKVPQSRFYTAVDLKDGKSENELSGGYVKSVGTFKITDDTTVTSGKTYYEKSGTAYVVKAPTTTNPKTEGLYEAVTEPGKDINFLVVHKPAVMKYNKHIVPRVFSPEVNQNGDDWLFTYRKYGLVDAYENKVAGIYLSYKA